MKEQAEAVIEEVLREFAEEMFALKRERLEMVADELLGGLLVEDSSGEARGNWDAAHEQAEAVIQEVMRNLAATTVVDSVEDMPEPVAEAPVKVWSRSAPPAARFTTQVPPPVPVCSSPDGGRH